MPCRDKVYAAGPTPRARSECKLHREPEKIKQLKASVRAKVKPPSRLVKQQFSYAKRRYGRLTKNTARLTMLRALGNLWMVRRQLVEAQG